jgi:hypothetical protein
VPVAVSRCLVVVLLAIAGWSLPAGAATGLYAGEVPVSSQADGERAEALKAALAQVVIKVSGDAAVVGRPEVAKAIANADKYVQQFQYAQGVVTDSSGQAQVRLSLIAQFGREAIDRLLADAGNAHAPSADTAQAPVEAQSGTYRVWVSGIASAEDYARLIGSLTRNELVRSVQTEQARGDGVQLKLDAAASLSRLLESLGNSPVHVLNAKPPVDGVDALLGMQQP